MLGFDDQRVALKVAGREQPLVLPGEQVVGIRVQWDQELVQQANAALREGNYPAAIINSSRQWKRLN